MFAVKGRAAGETQRDGRVLLSLIMCSQVTQCFVGN